MTSDDLRALDLGHRYRFERRTGPAIEGHLVSLARRRTCGGGKCSTEIAAVISVARPDGGTRRILIPAARLVGAVIL